MSTRLVIIVDVPTFDQEDKARTDPHELAEYFLDEHCDDPTFTFVGAEWDD